MSARVLEAPAPYFRADVTAWSSPVNRHKLARNSKRARAWRVRLDFFVETNEGEDLRAAIAAVGKRCLTKRGLRAVAGHRAGPARARRMAK